MGLNPVIAGTYCHWRGCQGGSALAAGSAGTGDRVSSDNGKSAENQQSGIDADWNDAEELC